MAKKTKSHIESLLIRELRERVPSSLVGIRLVVVRANQKAAGVRVKCSVGTMCCPVGKNSYGDGEETSQWDLYSNVVVGDYKLDLVLSTFYGTLAIECDGHDWHERTKQQAAYDRARDRFFLSKLLPTIRFTGSEIVHYTTKCAVEVYAIASAIDRQACALAHGGCSISGTPYRRYE